MITQSELVVLGILHKSGREMYGQEIEDQARDRLRTGSIYLWISALDRADLISCRQEDKSPDEGVRRTLYIITDKGKQVYSDCGGGSR